MPLAGIGKPLPRAGKAGAEGGRIEHPEDPADGVVRGRPTLQIEKLPQPFLLGQRKARPVHTAFRPTQAGAKGNRQNIQQLRVARVGTARVFQRGKRFGDS
jgi:hypothetical protein